MHLAESLRALIAPTAWKLNTAKITMMAITTRSSIREKPLRSWRRGGGLTPRCGHLVFVWQQLAEGLGVMFLLRCWPRVAAPGEAPNPRGGCGLGVIGTAKPRGNGRPARFPTDNTGGTPVTQLSGVWHRHPADGLGS